MFEQKWWSIEAFGSQPFIDRLQIAKFHCHSLCSFSSLMLIYGEIIIIFLLVHSLNPLNYVEYEWVSSEIVNGEHYNDYRIIKFWCWTLVFMYFYFILNNSLKKIIIVEYESCYVWTIKTEQKYISIMIMSYQWLKSSSRNNIILTVNSGLSIFGRSIFISLSKLCWVNEIRIETISRLNWMIYFFCFWNWYVIHLCCSHSPLFTVHEDDGYMAGYPIS